jgi:hypothetical protein
MNNDSFRTVFGEYDIILTYPNCPNSEFYGYTFTLDSLSTDNDIYTIRPSLKFKDSGTISNNSISKLTCTGNDVRIKLNNHKSFKLDYSQLSELGVLIQLYYTQMNNQQELSIVRPIEKL